MDDRCSNCRIILSERSKIIHRGSCDVCHGMLHSVLEREWFRLAHESFELDILEGMVRKRILMEGEEC